MVQTASIIMHYHAGAWERENIKRLTESAVRVYGSVIAGIPVIGFGSLFMMVRIVTSFFGGFFYARSSSSLCGGLGGGASARCFRCGSLPTPFNLPPVFGSSDGWNSTLGASL